MFEEKGHTVMPLDFWIEAFGLNGGGARRDAMANTLLLARIFQMLLVRAVGKQVDTAQQLIDESRASSFLRRNH
jgi:DNA polymerase-3 subunit epsilon